MPANQIEPHWELTALDAARQELTLGGVWQIGTQLPGSDAILERIPATADQLQIKPADDFQWDSLCLVFLNSLIKNANKRGIRPNLDALPKGVIGLLHLSQTAHLQETESSSGPRPNVLTRLGINSVKIAESIPAALEFLGEVFQSLGRLVRGKARMRMVDFWVAIEHCGSSAVGIVTLISFLVGLILAFVGAAQLQQFGAQIFIANLVALGMVREMGAMMTSIIMAGRTGSAFAAEIGTMQVNEEVDALSTLGIAPIDFLVLPRILALTLMSPLLCAYSDVMGILGGMVVGIGMFDISPVEYVIQTGDAMTLSDILLGIGKSALYGFLVALAGCYRGIRCGRSSAAVGASTTVAVVTSIVLIVIASAITTVMADILGI